MTGSKSVWRQTLHCFMFCKFLECVKQLSLAVELPVFGSAAVVGCSITAWVPTSDPSCQEGQLTCRWASSPWSACTQWAYGGAGTALLLALGSPQQPQYLVQVSSAPLYSLYFLRITVCELSVCIFVQHCLSGALEGQKKLMDLLD